MARLVLGELGHAMPMAAMAPAEHPTTATAVDPACAEHDSGGMAHPADVADAASSHAGSEHDCCKSGDCECPCLHVPCVTLDAAVMSPGALTLLSIPHGVDAIAAVRPSRLFRPPA